jgi:hypothetical protein
VKNVSVIGKWTVGSVQQGERSWAFGLSFVFGGGILTIFWYSLEARIWTKTLILILGKTAWETSTQRHGVTSRKTWICNSSAKSEVTPKGMHLPNCKPNCLRVHSSNSFARIPVGIHAGRKWPLCKDSGAEGKDHGLQPIEADARRREQITRDCWGCL